MPVPYNRRTRESRTSLEQTPSGSHDKGDPSAERGSSAPPTPWYTSRCSANTRLGQLLLLLLLLLRQAPTPPLYRRRHRPSPAHRQKRQEKGAVGAEGCGWLMWPARDRRWWGSGRTFRGSGGCCSRRRTGRWRWPARTRSRIGCGWGWLRRFAPPPLPRAASSSVRCRVVVPQDDRCFISLLRRFVGSLCTLRRGGVVFRSGFALAAL